MKERALILLMSYINTTPLFEGILSFLLQGVPLKYFPRFFHQNPITYGPYSTQCALYLTTEYFLLNSTELLISTASIFLLKN